MSDPKLKEAMAEIMGVLKKHDIAGDIVLVSPTHAEFRTRIDPSWSGAFFEDSGAVRIRAKKADLGTQEAVNERLENTVHMFTSLRDISAMVFKQSAQILGVLEQQAGIEIEYSPVEFEPHREN
jgi:hypothetical protein